MPLSKSHKLVYKHCFHLISGELLKVGANTAGRLKIKEGDKRGCSRADREETEMFDIYTARYVMKDVKRYEISDLEFRKIILYEQ